MKATFAFWDVVDKSDGCWLWTRTRNREGYGVYTYQGRTYKAHRWAWMQTVGAIPEGLEIDHLCRNPSCVRPDHLQAVDHRTNVLRGVGPTAVNAKKTTCDKGHQFDRVNSRSARICSKCTNAYKREWKRIRRTAAAA